jgi:hypothetical protein
MIKKKVLVVAFTVQLRVDGDERFVDVNRLVANVKDGASRAAGQAQISFSAPGKVRDEQEARRAPR